MVGVLQIFYESFDEDFEGRWIASENPDYTGFWFIQSSISLLLIGVLF